MEGVGRVGKEVGKKGKEVQEVGGEGQEVGGRIEEGGWRRKDEEGGGRRRREQASEEQEGLFTRMYKQTRLKGLLFHYSKLNSKIGRHLTSQGISHHPTPHVSRRKK